MRGSSAAGNRCVEPGEGLRRALWEGLQDLVLVLGGESLAVRPADSISFTIPNSN